MKILFIHPNLSRYASKQISALSKKKEIEIYLLCGKPDVSVYSIDSFDKICQKIWQDLPVVRYPYQYKSIIKKIDNIVKKWEIDVVNVYSMPDDLAVAAIEAGSAPIIYCARDLTSTFSKELLASRVFPKKIVSNKLNKNK